MCHLACFSLLRKRGYVLMPWGLNRISQQLNEPHCFMFLLVFHVKHSGLGMALGCGSPPLLAVVGIGVSRETIPLMERILLVAPPCFT